MTSLLYLSAGSWGNYIQTTELLSILRITCRNSQKYLLRYREPDETPPKGHNVIMIGLEQDGKAEHKELLTVPEAAKYLGIGRSRMYEKVQAGEVPSIKLSARRTRVRLEDLEGYVREHQRS